MLNATTTLLWLCQTCSHEGLLLLIVLGALVVVVSSAMLISSILVRFRLVCRLGYYILYIIYNIIFTYFFRSVARRGYSVIRDFNTDGDGDIVRANPLISYAPRSLGLGRNLDRSSRRLSLPQSLALHPQQWAEIESSPTSSYMPDSLPPSASSSRSNSRSRIVASSASPLRRSSRTPRPRVVYSSCLAIL